MPNAYEIDYLPVGENSKSGDAIAIRIGDYESSQWKNQRVFIIDGGNLASGGALVKHVNEIYKTDKVDRVFLTHPDGDHASGLRPVIEHLQVGKIWMHRPWNYWNDLKDSLHDGRITKTSFGERLQTAYQFAYDVEQLAKRKGIEIFPPHQGCYYHINNEPIFSVLGPGKDFYLSLIQTSDKTPKMGIQEGIAKSFSELKKKTEYETLDFRTEHLCESDGDTSSENDMSLILLFTCAGKKALFTADAGTMGLYKAVYYCVQNNINLKDLTLFHVPHHGSRHNLSQNILKYIHAPHAIVSSAVNGEPSHPSAIVTNALIRRSIHVYTTKGKTINFRGEAVPMRSDWSSAPTVNFQNWVEVPI
ncbi:MAG: ComEC/Rec2 family competence protein [Ginsengibacter sp.]